MSHPLGGLCVLCARVLQGKYFYLTPGVCPSLSTLKSILESAGGKLLAKQPSYRKIIEHKQNKVKHKYSVSFKSDF